MTRDGFQPEVNTLDDQKSSWERKKKKAWKYNKLGKMKGKLTAQEWRKKIENSMRMARMGGCYMMERFLLKMYCGCCIFVIVVLMRVFFFFFFFFLRCWRGERWRRMWWKYPQADILKNKIKRCVAYWQSCHVLAV